jgi:outer membrane protein OmpA-like peptidoglycan-associated protein
MMQSRHRAAAVKVWLAIRGVAAARLTDRGYGDTLPPVPNRSGAGRAWNRRAELERLDCQ